MNDELVSQLKATVAALDAADVPAPLREVAFGRAFDVISGAAKRADRVPDDSSGPATPGAGATPGSEPPAVHSFAGIAKELDLETELVERLFDEHGEGELQFVGTLERFGPTKQAMVDGIAVLLCSARAAGGYDADGRVSDAVIRAEVERHGLYDVTNYSKHMKNLRQLANANGTGRSTTFKLKYEGRMRARELARLALGASDS